MKNLSNPKWLLLINTVPIILLLFLLRGQYQIIHTLLDTESIALWKQTGWLIGGLGFINLVYTSILITTKKRITIYYAITALIGYIIFIYTYLFQVGEFLPMSIPRWMRSTNIELYPATFLIPTLLYSLFILITHFTKDISSKKPWLNFLMAAAVPLSWYIGAQLIFPLWQKIGDGFSEHFLIILCISGVLIFIFFLIRGIYILTLKRTGFFHNYPLVWKIPFCIAFPLMGLALNNGHLMSGRYLMHIFGDFSNLWFYILAFANGLILCIPNIEHKITRIFIFILRCIGFSFIFYFFLVFLPYLPLSVIAIIAFGLGVLMLAPLIVFVVQVNQISQDYSYLKNLFSTLSLKVIGGISFMVIPMIITINYLETRKTLHNSLDYIYHPDYDRDYHIDLDDLNKTLAKIKSHKSRNNDFWGGSELPYLSSYFKWLVLDNLTLSNTKIDHLEAVFLGEPSYPATESLFPNDHVRIQDLKTETTYDQKQKVYRSWVHLDIKNHLDRRNQEYITTLDLPEACFISNYYLYVNDQKEMGLLTEKKSAMWVFNQIRNQNRDPGLLHYTSGNKVAFRVFPFNRNELRKTGIEFIHKEAITLEIDDRTITLGQPTDYNASIIENENLVYIPALEKNKLNTGTRKPYFHFMVDVSTDSNDLSTYYDRIDAIKLNYPGLAQHAKVSLINTEVHDFKCPTDCKHNHQNKHHSAGYFLQRAFRKTLVDAYKNNTDSYPVIVVLNPDVSTLDLTNFDDLQFCSPEGNPYFTTDSLGFLDGHMLFSSSKEEMEYSDPSFKFPVRTLPLQDGNVIYLTDNNQASIYVKPQKNIGLQSKESYWKNALHLNAQWKRQLLYPDLSEDMWLSLIKQSFSSRILTPVTSFIVVENDAQKAMLLKKQEQVLSGKKSLDAGEDTRRMSEPGILFLLICLMIILFWNKRKDIKLRKIKNANIKF